MIFLAQLFTLYKLLSKGATTVKFENHVSVRVRKYDEGVFLSRLHLHAWSWRETARVNIFLWQLSATMKKRTTRSCRWQNVVPMDNNWLTTTGAAEVTMEKASSLLGSNPYIPSKLCTVWLHLFRLFPDQLIRSGGTWLGCSTIFLSKKYLYREVEVKLLLV